MKLNDRALSDVIATTMLLGVTIMLVGASAVAFQSTAVEAHQPAPARLDVVAHIEATNSVQLTHAGGPAVSTEDVDVVVTVAGGWSQRVPLQSATTRSTWAIGDQVDLALSRSIAPGDHVEVLVVSKRQHGVVATVLGDVPQSAAPPAAAGASTGAPLSLTLQPLTSAVVPGGTFLLLADAEHDSGRTAIRSISLDLSALGGSSSLPLYDDGTHGDTYPADLRYATNVIVPTTAPLGPGRVITVTAFDVAGRSATASLPVTVQNAYGATATTPPILDASDPFTPDAVSPNSLVTVSGSNLASTTAVRLVDPTSGAAYHVTWWTVTAADGTTRIEFIVPPGTPVNRSYQVAVTNPAGTTQTEASLFVAAHPSDSSGGGGGGSGTSTPMTKPNITSFTPGAANPQEAVQVNGTGFLYATSVILVNENITLPPTWYSAGDTRIMLLIPPGTQPNEYEIVVSNPLGEAYSPQNLTVLSPPPLWASHVSPAAAEPYKPVIVSGSGFNDLVSVTLGEYAVSWTRNSDTEFVFYTHAGVPPGAYHLVMSSRTSQTIAPFNFTAMAAAEKHMYPDWVFSAVSHAVVKLPGKANEVTVYLKVNLTEDVDGPDGTLQLTDVKMKYVRFKPGDNGEASLGTPTCTPTGALGARTGVWHYQAKLTIPQYDSARDTLDYYFVLTWEDKSKNQDNQKQYLIDSSSADRHFSLLKNHDRHVILEQGLENVYSCTPA